ncbi:cyclic nucleotide-binding domain-containing protein [Absicoccus intestinalis]|uniref:Cyclic nucleotide-binding domain-containing protein n=1 Tax=Absicoccus intestinalis TaxID=2926319 RepID=A0ABU4WNK6_9FIRM|nr:cyclic nucleotide-binding domain-containing protein [Absicoccus sp. CLA-KB-P134]MDX8417115.1 cyclic nucleotide-binding domain-containing protein [Absicoccus sp. CLA-KB-P134]
MHSEQPIRYLLHLIKSYYNKKDKEEKIIEEHLCVALVPLFHDLSRQEQQKIMKLVHHRTYEKNEEIFRPGDERLDIVASGRLKVYELTASGKEQLLRVVGPGGYEGEKQEFICGLTFELQVLFLPHAMWLSANSIFTYEGTDARKAIVPADV